MANTENTPANTADSTEQRVSDVQASAHSDSAPAHIVAALAAKPASVRAGHAGHAGGKRKAVPGADDRQQLGRFFGSKGRHHHCAGLGH